MPKSSSIWDEIQASRGRGLLPFGSAHASVVGAWTLGVAPTDPRVTVVGSPDFDPLLGMLAGTTDCLQIDFSSDGLAAGGQIRFEVPWFWLTRANAIWQSAGLDLAAFEVVLTAGASNSSSASPRVYVQKNSNERFGATLQNVADAGSPYESSLDSKAFTPDADGYAPVHLWWDHDTDLWSLMAGDTLVVWNQPYTYAATIWNVITLGNDRGDGNACSYRLRNFQASTLVPDFVRTTRGLVSMIGDSQAEYGRTTWTQVTGSGTFTSSGTAVTGSGSSFDTEVAVGDLLYSSSNKEYERVTAVGSATGLTLLNGFATDVASGENVVIDSQAGELFEVGAYWGAHHMLLMMGKALREYAVQLEWVEKGSGGRNVADSLSPAIGLTIPGLLAENPQIVIYKGGTNDCLDGALADDFESSLKSHMLQILTHASVRALIICTVPSLYHNPAYDEAQYLAATDAANELIRSLPGWWDRLYPTRAGRLLVVDTWVALGGDEPDERNYYGVLRDPDTSDIHVAGRGHRIEADLLLDKVIDVMRTL